MADINEWNARIRTLLDAYIEAARSATLTELTRGMATPEWRLARVNERRAFDALASAKADREYLREKLARACDPWFCI